jgi:hypothetical protein
MITNGAKLTRRIETNIAMAKTAFNRKNNFFHQQIGLKFKEEIFGA